jgi:hypothetical protein
MTRQLAGHHEPNPEDVIAEEVDARRPAACGRKLELGQDRRRSAGYDDPEVGLDELRACLAFLIPLLVAGTLLPVIRPICPRSGSYDFEDLSF